ncbi:MAG: cyclic nucleotide-binding domain-containing protein [Rhodospirillaceae bacterium]|nr:cyclic nucleotide-binding domain-containing protein [Rhodospirillaceae bacterium]MBT5239757.1 cyclic nucleotide-binding domain-containing protein [Rhodospirillaceae bacterium]MBT5567227.1 cyclic nucleotide-binding domain-containing protein [Rhodospirillaceae bacterium]MBT6089440.1 cyclic nucleotide-binding domain-containing protein [Rhodospirillaceae bacterium]MBT6962349.1 cyclic nucleotide-binding domain-containing protein [Rhodospirillaceae bacterium]
MSASGLLSEKASTKILNRESFGPDTVIFKEGDRGVKAYVVTRGTVDIVTKTVDGKYKKLKSFNEGEMFGEMSLLNGEKRSAHAISKDGCELLVVEQTVLKEKLDAADPFIKFWIEFLSERIRDMSKRVS